ncbi:type II secretion system protein [Streptomyces caniscabiei]|uniref:type II secretion system protein n=1 Tax=Streptomyces caniscabiei TaxID=2746961 RepID=UPI0029AEFFC8|nr:type II secretion system protein [Streptomyces caniscabiei]MDX2776557.1 type II secretion system protein [Streptomyces caniscabiei]
MKRTQSGFTVIELIIVIIFLSAATILLFIQRGNLEAADRDDKRKTAINAMYYNLEEVFYAKNGYYPATIDEKKLPAMDPALFTDPYGNKIGTSESEYRYEATGCTNDKCKGYTLRADLEKEDDFVKSNNK